MERYLIYDAGCSACRQLGELVQQVAGRRLTAIHIRDSKAVDLLDRARPEGWDLAPYLVFAETDRVRAWTGTAAATRLVALVGLRGAWRIWASARRHGIYFPPGPATSSVSRRAFLKLSASFTAVLIGFGFRPSKALAAQCDEQTCYKIGCTGTGVCGYPPKTFWCQEWDCYDKYNGAYCQTIYNPCSCYGCS